MNNNFEKASRKRRIAAILIDHFVFCFLMVMVTFLIIGPSFVDEEGFSNKFHTYGLYIFILGILIYFNKDMVNGISIGRWITGTAVREMQDYQLIPSRIKLFIRNVFIVIWPIELVVLALSDNKQRIGDKITKTEVIKNPNPPRLSLRLSALIGIGLIFIVSTLTLTGSMLKGSEAYSSALKYIEGDNEVLRKTGGIRKFGNFPSGGFNISNGEGNAEFNICIKGNAQDVDVVVRLEKHDNANWEVIRLQTLN